MTTDIDQAAPVAGTEPSPYNQVVTFDAVTITGQRPSPYNQVLDAQVTENSPAISGLDLGASGTTAVAPPEPPPDAATTFIDEDGPTAGAASADRPTAFATWWQVLAGLAASGAASMAHFGPNHIDVPAADHPEFLTKLEEVIKQQDKFPIASDRFAGHQIKIAQELNKAVKYLRNGGDKAREIAEKAFDLARPSFARIGLWLGSIDDLELSPIIILHVPKELLKREGADPGPA
jgi:hypothetical protein